jgi:antitoxin component of MazEF toxin-antitoxin module
LPIEAKSGTDFQLFTELSCPIALDTAFLVTCYYMMVKMIPKVGNSHGIIFDSTLMDLAHLKAGDEVNVEVHADGTITLTPLRPRPSGPKIAKVIKATMKKLA